MRQERKTRAKKSSTSRAGRRKVSDPRLTNHLMLFTSEREACDARAKRLGLGFSSWARFKLLSDLSTELEAGKVPPDSVKGVCRMLARALFRELWDLSEAKRKESLEKLWTAFSSGNLGALIDGLWFVD